MNGSRTVKLAWPCMKKQLKEYEELIKWEKAYKVYIE